MSKTKNQNREAMMAKRAEIKRRRMANKGDGSAFVSAMVFEGKLVNDELVKETMERIERLERIVAQLTEEVANRDTVLPNLIAQSIDLKQQADAIANRLHAPSKSSIWRKLVHERMDLQQMIQNMHDERSKNNNTILSARMEVASAKEWLRTMKHTGTGLQRCWIKVWEDKRRRNKHSINPEEKDIREAPKVKEKEHIRSFNVLTFSPSKVNAKYVAAFAAYQKFIPYYGDDPMKKKLNQQALQKARKGVALLKELLKEDAGKPFVCKRSDGRITRLPVTKLSKIFGIDDTMFDVKTELVVVNHSFEEMVDGPWQVFGLTEEEGLRAKEAIIKSMYRRLMASGFVVEGEHEEPEMDYRFCFASSSHQKQEKATMVLNELAEVHEEYLYFGHKLEEFVQQSIKGAVFLKGMANRVRPDVAILKTIDGEPVSVFDVLRTQDVKRIYHHGRALKIGGNYDGKPYLYCSTDDEVILGDGQMIALQELSLCGQVNGEGWKGFIHNSSTVLEELCRKHGLTKEEFLDCIVETADGRKVRVGDYKIICGAGCWKFDGLFKSYEEYLNWIRRMMEIYPGVEYLSILRQMDDLENQRRHRELTRSLIQQFVWMSNAEVKALTKKTVKRLNSMKAMDTQIRRMAGLDKDENDRTELEKLFENCPWLVAHPNVLKYVANQFYTLQTRAMANKLMTTGSYPYIIQDPVALLEVWVLGKDPNSNDLGILKAGEASINEVPDGTEVGAVRFPSNYYTVRTLICRSHSKVFECCGNAMVLNIYDDFLIRNDGDVDGDETGVYTNPLIVRLIKRMIEEINPPVVVFEHGSKAHSFVPGSVREFWKVIGDALYSAKHNGEVGKYANLARDCAYLMSVAYMKGNDKDIAKYDLYMAAASTGAILAIDQVKGNDISLPLIKWLKKINDEVKAAMHYLNPYTQQYVKGIDPDRCLAPNSLVVTDNIAESVYEQTGDFEFDPQGLDWEANKDIISSWLMVHNVEHYSVRTNVLNDSLVASMRTIHYNDTAMDDGTVMDAKFLDRVKKGQEVGLKDILMFYWHNLAALKQRLEGRMLEEAEEDFYEHTRKSLLEFATSNKKPNGDGHVRSKDEEKASLYVSMLDNALEFTKGNGLADATGSYTMMILEIIAPWMNQVFNKNRETLNCASPSWNVPEAEDTNWDDEKSEED